MKIIITTKNQAKIQAVQEVFEQVWSEVQTLGQRFESEVPEQPLSELVGIQGAINRAQNAKKFIPGADYYIGMEGYVDSNEFGMFLGGIVAIIDKDGTIGIGSSAKMQLPQNIAEQLINGQELGPLIAARQNDVEGKIRQFDGTNGLLSKGMYTRVDEFKDATKCALTRFISPEYFTKI